LLSNKGLSCPLIPYYRDIDIDRSLTVINEKITGSIMEPKMSTIYMPTFFAAIKSTIPVLLAYEL